MIRRRGPLYVYDGRDLFAVVEHRADGWHATIRDNRFGPFASHEMALAMVNAKRANVPAGTIVGERDADTKRVNRIRNHQRQAQTRIAESCRAQCGASSRRGNIVAGWTTSRKAPAVGCPVKTAAEKGN